MGERIERSLQVIGWTRAKDLPIYLPHASR
jgi:hypothetical protein